ncbi:uncharacterized protein EI97DRAFT_432614 [Westerdykella ornata]|uniref:Zn(2)-C6 fungal-type domain-containing protein n=1 Tax=Westerdykella ornata TaxID=318751 RepID=A0A6A6JMW7_WESOR|nr:uncharacterized protein EI97DRAFT_432614 [Westerdykella ornata]KAF2276996.1 hypothetical protein EI97DRAFT_432614 [Westerdykella ornata]
MHTRNSAQQLYATANDIVVGVSVPTNRPRVRTFSHKVRTGCITCRIRRKKCDEEKPTCRRCRDSRVKCDGYAQSPSKNKKPRSQKYTPADTSANPSASAAVERLAGQCQLRSTLPAIRLDFDLDGSESDRLFFHHFRAITIVDFVRLATPKDFWFRRVLPMCHDEPAIRHTVVALGAAHHFYLQRHSNSCSTGTNAAMSPFERVATQHYNKAIRELVSLNDIATPKPWDAQLTILTCCLLFVCLENILGRFDEAVRHMQAGARLFEASNLSAAPHDSRELMQEIATLLARFAVDASLFANDYVIPDLTPYAMPLIEIDEGTQPFSSLTEARDAIWDLDIRAPYIDCLRASGDGPVGEDSSTHNKLTKLAAPFERWKTKFNLLVSSLAETRDLPNSIQREILVLMLRRCTWDILLFQGNEDKNKELWKLCHELIHLAERLYSIEASWLGRPMFTLDSDSIPALFFVAISCGDSALMQRIIVLLRHSRRREGSWDSWKAADKVEIENQMRAVLSN